MKTIPREQYPVLLRKVAWDVLPCNEVQTMLPALTLHPSSAEGAEVEHHDSHQRIGRLAPLEDHIAVYSAMAARVAAASALHLNVGEAPDPNIHGLVLTQFAETGHIAASVTLAHLLEEGIISINLEKLQ
jgi:hypothetical protein